MKLFYGIVVLSVLLSCSSARMTDSWKSDDYANYQPKKVLIVGITDNLTARKIFEQSLKEKLLKRNVFAVESSLVFEKDFMDSRQTQEQIDKEVNRFVAEGFDAVLISAVKGVDNQTSYSGKQFSSGYYWHHFGRYYYLYQDVYFEPGYYNSYKVYHIEASLYNIKTNNDKSLVWVASYDIVDPVNITSTANDYARAIVKSLEEASIINSNK